MAKFDFNVILKNDDYKTEEEQLQFLAETIKAFGLAKNESATKEIYVAECSDSHANIVVKEKDATGKLLTQNIINLETDIFSRYGVLKDISLSPVNKLDWRFGNWQELTCTYWINGQNVEFEEFKQKPREKPVLVRSEDENAQKAIAAMWAHILGKPSVSLEIWIDYAQNVAFIWKRVQFRTEFELNEVIWRLIEEDDKIIAFEKLVKANQNDEFKLEF